MPSATRYRAKDGTISWRVRLRAGGRQTSETFSTKDEAQEFIDDVEQFGAEDAIQRRTDLADSAGHLRLDELADAFFDWKAPKVRSDRTLADYRRDYTTWISPTFGRRRASSLTNDDVQAWVDGMLAGTAITGRKGISAKTAIDKHTLLHSILEYGVLKRHLPTNATKGTDLPKKQKPAPKGLRLPEWEALHRALRQIDPDAADLAQFLLGSGWRWSEATALSVAQVDDFGDTLYVSMDRVLRRNAAGQIVIVEEGKGQASIRRTRLGDDTAAMLRRRVQGKALDALVFTTPVSTQNGMGGNQWRHSNFVQRYWKPAVKACGLESRRPTPHWLRHTQVAWLNEFGATLAELQARSGHAHVTTTIGVYGRMINDVSAEKVNAFDRLVAGTVTPQLDAPGPVEP